MPSDELFNREEVLGERGRFLLSVSPMVIVLLVTEWLLLTGEGSFAGSLSDNDNWMNRWRVWYNTPTLGG
ncbi:MAG: hypothetical protein ACE5JP_06110 [Candidatus Bipolaricaulia bacterium]